MTEAPEGDGLQGAWGRSYREAWRPQFDAFFEDLKAEPINVLLWGPGTSTPYYEKREQIGASLGDDSTSVATSEALLAANPDLQGLDDELLAEEMQADSADIVIALTVDDAGVTGVHLELSTFQRHPRIAPKIHLFAPRRVGPAARALLLTAARRVPEPRKFEYTPEQYEDCQEMRAKARAWVEVARREKALMRYRTQGSARLQPPSAGG